MIVKIVNLPDEWAATSNRSISVRVSSAPPGAECRLELYQTSPGPERLLDTRELVVGTNGLAVARFDVAFSSPGTTVLHCEASVGGLFDSDSAATLVR
jgi:hypothetical protein